MLNYSANGPSGYNLTNSLRFRASASARLSRTFASTGTNNKIQTLSVWVKRGLLSSSTVYRLMGCYDGSSANSTEINFTNDNLKVEFGGAANNALTSTQVFRDPSAWYHIVIAIDTTQATSSNRVKMYVNGTQVTAFSTANYPAQNAASQLTSANANNSIGSGWSGFEYFDGYMTEINFIDGQALTPSSFGSTNSTTGVWQPARYTGSYGTNGFYLKFSDIATTSGSNTGLGKDSSGNGNYWNTNNISVTAGTTYDAMTDVPTLTSATVANYAVWNPNYKDTTATTTSTSNGNLTTNGQFAYSTIGVTTGKFYFELTIGSANTQFVGVCASPYSATNARVYNKDGTYYTGSGWVSYGATYTTNDVIGVALDMTNQTIEFYKNNTSQGQKTSIGLSNQTIFPMVYVESSGGITVNFGQQGFKYTPPTGFVALNTYNLPDSTIVQGNKYMDATLYTGNGSAGTDVQTITNASSFKPDLVWTKSRSNVVSHHIGDSVRGIDKTLFSNTAGAEATYTYDIHAFNSNGFTVGNDGSQNTSGYTYVGWQWQAGQGSTSSNTSGTITSTTSVNSSAGFSVVTYTGVAGGVSKTIGHGLGVTPAMIFVKDRGTASTGTGYFVVQHKSLGAAYVLYLGLTNAATSAANAYWGNPHTNPTSTVFTVGGDSNNVSNENTHNYVAYCWAAISGFSAFGSYTGNGSTDGVFVYTGFLPRFVMIKNYSSGGSWVIHDTARDTYNVTNKTLYPNYSNAESTPDAPFDVLSNGFKLRSATLNDSGAGFIYAAFAENPFKNANAR